MSIGKHYETGESIPDDIYKKLLAARTFRAGSLSLRQVGAALSKWLLIYSARFPFLTYRKYATAWLLLTDMETTYMLSCIFQLRFATLDLELHTKYVPGGSESIFHVDRRVSEKTQVLPPLPEDKFLCSFSHIFAGGYAAGYYSYKVIFWPLCINAWVCTWLHLSNAFLVQFITTFWYTALGINYPEYFFSWETPCLNFVPT